MNIDVKLPKKRILCPDGFSISVQASQFAYCTPRNDTGPYSTVECGYPSEKVSELMKYAENSEDPCNTVYGWVPIEIVKSVLKSHGYKGNLQEHLK